MPTSSASMRSAVPTSEQYSVFRAYLDQRHRHGGMADMTVLDYAMMVEDSHVETRIIEYRRRGVDSRHHRPRRRRLLAVALTDVLSDGLSMVYSFFEPSRRSRSLGTFMILDHITRAPQARAALRLSRLLDRGLARRWTTRAASCRSSGWRRQAGCGWTPPAKCRPSRRIDAHCRHPATGDQYAADSRLNHERLWNTGSPVKPGDDGCVCGYSRTACRTTASRSESR